ncbi:hypothetical protein DMC61_14535 [Amycolatopsis sp. WAC 04169]|nr:hypothetical protein DMC61_14535 [Amycolatopsis sp. WAC 04169]
MCGDQDLMQFDKKLVEVIAIEHSQPRQVTQLGNRRAITASEQRLEPQMSGTPAGEFFQYVQITFREHDQPGAIFVTHSRTTSASSFQHKQSFIGQVAGLEDLIGSSHSRIT